LIALTSAQARLAVAQEQLADVRHDGDRLKHRIQLLDARDPDIIQEIARDQLLGTTTGQVAVPREKR
jgi:cell division protein FtsB